MRQFLYVVIVLVFFGIAELANAQSFIGPEFKYAEDSKPSILVNGLYRKVTPIGESDKSVGYYVYGLANRSWAQIHGGLAFQPTSWTGFSIGAGTEKSDSPWRAAAGFFVAGRGNFAMFAMEEGGSSMWYRVHYTRTINSKLNLGVISRRHSPTGIYVEIKEVLPHSMLWIMVGPNVENGEKTAIFGINVALP